MKLRTLSTLLALACGCANAQLELRQSLMQHDSFPRLESALLAVTPPSARVQGEPGTMRIIERGCVSNSDMAGLRQRIVNIAVQEWAWFGFNVEDQRGTRPPDPNASRNGGSQQNLPRRFLPLDPAVVAQVAPSVIGYWAATPDSDWILARQNETWRSNQGLSSRWRDPWSAAFISWVMCESGIGDRSQFARAIAHHTYIDQAIEAQQGRKPGIYHAFEPGAAAINPGDLLCNGLRPMYRTLAQRRAQLGVGARTHCDIVVSVDEAAGQILTIGGNVRSSVRMKIFPASSAAGSQFAPEPTARPIFVHLQLQAPQTRADALNHAPTLQTLGCRLPAAPQTFVTASIELPTPSC